MTACRVQGQARECSLQLSITPGAGRDSHGELPSLPFIYLFRFQVSPISTSLPYFLSSSLPLFMFQLSCQPRHDLSAARRFYTLAYTWILLNNSSSGACFIAGCCLQSYPNYMQPCIPPPGLGLQIIGFQCHIMIHVIIFPFKRSE